MIRIANVNNLYVAEHNKDIPFAIERVFWVTNFSGKRGGHANLTTREYVFVIKGAVRFILENNGKREGTVLRDPGIGLYIGEKTWVQIQSVEPHSSYLVLADSPYNKVERIDDYTEFLKL